MSPIIPRQGLHFPNDRSENRNRCYALRRVIGSVAARLCDTTMVKMLCFPIQIFSVSCFVSGVTPRNWSSRNLVIFAVLSRATEHWYTRNYLWIFIITVIEKFRTLTRAPSTQPDHFRTAGCGHVIAKLHWRSSTYNTGQNFFKHCKSINKFKSIGKIEKERPAAVRHFHNP